MVRPSEGQAGSKHSRGRTVPIVSSTVGVSQSRSVFSDAASRDDLYALPRRQSEHANTWRPNTGGGRLHEPKNYPAWTSQEKPAMRTPDYSSKSLPHSGQIKNRQHVPLDVGMALGSPSHSPWSSNPITGPTSAQSFLATTPSGLFSAVPYEPSLSPGPEEAAKQKGRWKVFGGLFSRKNSSPMSAPANRYFDESPTAHEDGILHLHPLKPSQRHEVKHNKSSSRSLDLGVATTVSTTISSSSYPIRPRPSIPRIQTTPAFPTKRRSPTPPPKDRTPKQAKPQLPPTPPMLLEIDIPDVSMERYSVMFGNVLEPRKSSLMTRRQAQLERLKVIDDFPEGEEGLEENKLLCAPVRRTTLPSPAKPSSYSLFPPTPDQTLPPRSSSRSPGALHRSVTAPSISPARPEFAARRVFADTAQVQSPLEFQSPTSSTPSPETPKYPTWYPRILPKQSEVNLLEEQSANPRDQIMEIVIQFPESLPPAAPMKQIYGRDKHETARPIEVISTPVIAEKSQPMTRPVAKTATPTSPYSDRLASLNKPLPSPLSKPSHDHCMDSLAHWKGSLPLQSKYNLQFREQRNGSLPTPSVFTLKTSAPRKASLALEPPRARENKPRLREHTRPTQTQPPRALEVQAQLPAEDIRPREQITTSECKPPNPLKSSPASAAEISIARQISISRRQHIMVPIVPKTVRQPQQATLVVPNSPDGAEYKPTNAKGYTSRKSHHILLETA